MIPCHRSFFSNTLLFLEHYLLFMWHDLFLHHHLHLWQHSFLGQHHLLFLQLHLLMQYHLLLILSHTTSFIILAHAHTRAHVHVWANVQPYSYNSGVKPYCMACVTPPRTARRESSAKCDVPSAFRYARGAKFWACRPCEWAVASNQSIARSRSEQSQCHRAPCALWRSIWGSKVDPDAVPLIIGRMVGWAALVARN